VIISIIIIVAFMVPADYTQASAKEPPAIPPAPVAEVFRGGMKYAFLLCWDDGQYDLDFSYLENPFGIKHTSFVVTSTMYNRLLWGLDMLFRGHDIQSHSLYHLNHRFLDTKYRAYLLKQSRADIERLFGYTPILFAYPYGGFDSQLQGQVLEYYRVGRGIIYEIGNDLGSWPVSPVAYAKHSFPGHDGVAGSTIDKLLTSFYSMVQMPGTSHIAYKAYGHTQAFNAAQKEDLVRAFSNLTSRTDTWFTSWGEAIAYQLERDSLQISDYEANKGTISFRTQVPQENNLGIKLTYRVYIPDDWKGFTVADDGKATNQYTYHTDGNARYILLDSIPRGQTIAITTRGWVDTSAPLITNMRTIATSEGMAFLAHVDDRLSFIKQVNITITGNGSLYEYADVQTPIFWANSTYGCVVFNLKSGYYQFKVSAVDCFGNVAVSAYNFELRPDYRIDVVD
jgi:peptidoglycan/xylan/chitin deacetylase (PgdA/CDA1 family)